MRRVREEETALPSARQLRLVLQCREPRDARICEELTFAFARSGGLRGAEVWYVAACALNLASHAVERGGGDLELRAIERPRAGIELTLRHGGAVPKELPVRLQRARHYVSELFVERHGGTGTVVTARQWLPDA